MSMSLKDYAEALANTDWFTDYSDDSEVRRRGTARQVGMRLTARQSHNHRRLLDLHLKHRDSTDSEDRWRWVAAYLFVYGWSKGAAEVEGRRLAQAKWHEVVAFRTKYGRG